MLRVAVGLGLTWGDALSEVATCKWLQLWKRQRNGLWLCWWADALSGSWPCVYCVILGLDCFWTVRCSSGYIDIQQIFRIHIFIFILSQRCTFQSFGWQFFFRYVWVTVEEGECVFFLKQFGVPDGMERIIPSFILALIYILRIVVVGLLVGARLELRSREGGARAWVTSNIARTSCLGFRGICLGVWVLVVSTVWYDRMVYLMEPEELHRLQFLFLIKDLRTKVYLFMLLLFWISI